MRLRFFTSAKTKTLWRWEIHKNVVICGPHECLNILSVLRARRKHLYVALNLTAGYRFYIQSKMSFQHSLMLLFIFDLSELICPLMPDFFWCWVPRCWDPGWTRFQNGYFSLMNVGEISLRSISCTNYVYKGASSSWWLFLSWEVSPKCGVNDGI